MISRIFCCGICGIRIPKPKRMGICEKSFMLASVYAFEGYDYPVGLRVTPRGYVNLWIVDQLGRLHSHTASCDLCKFGLLTARSCRRMISKESIIGHGRS